MSSLYMKASSDQVAKYVIFSGDPWRIEVIKEYLDNPVQIAFAREYNTYTGTYKGVPVTVTSTGIGAPSAAIAMEEMYECGMEVAVRMGTTMSLNDDLLGKFIIPIGAMREESTSETYVPSTYPAVADFELIQAMNKATTMLGSQYDNGINCTMDGFYSQMRESRLSKQMGTNIHQTFEDLKKYNISCIDMESSCMLTVGRLMNVKTCVVTMVTVLENLKQVLEGEIRTQSEDLLCRVTLEGIYQFHQSKQ
ncbi:nucleoside phosphorylase [Vibrio scophthalmi]|uniref:nucleoside phosphorylase n=1 Tax=Vibrio TaxID=662 RepID=UPI00021BE92C|nr:nucleoside phosphorylase [Vibrio sp. N418]EGU35254.1 uridine phosphorylase [Vibrio sp. N418]